MADHHPVSVDQHQVKHAEDTWHNFMQAAKWSAVAIAVVLSIMAATLIYW